LGSLERGLDIIEYLAFQSESCSLDKIVNELSIPRTSCFRILKSLQDKRYIQLAKSTGREQKWELTYKLSIFAQMIEDRTSLRNISHPHMVELAEETDLFVQLGILVNDKIMYIDDIKRAKALRVYAAKWSFLDIHACAAGLVLAAYLPKERLDEIIEEHGLLKKTENTITDKSELESKLSEIKVKQYAIDEEYYASGIKCIAAPIFNYRGEAVAAVGITGHSEEFKGKWENLIEKVKICAFRISQQLEYKQE